MARSGRFWLFSVAAWFWQGLDGLRKVLHLALLLLLLAVIVAGFVRTPPQVDNRSALVIAPVGDLVDQLDGDAATRAWQELLGARPRQTLTRDLREAILRAATDERISALVLQLGGMGGAGLASLRSVRDAITDFKASGKPVVAIGDSYDQGQYYLAAHADEIYMHPEGLVFLQGFASYRTYYRSALDKLLVDVNVFKVGEYKSFVEPWLRDDMSPEARENSLQWLGGLWQVYQEDVTAALDSDDALLERYTRDLPRFLEEADGDFGELAVAMSLVDELKTRSEMDERLVELTGRDPRDHGWRGIHHHDYLTALRFERPRRMRPDQVGVVVAEGDILDGVQPPGAIGGDSTAAILRDARFDDAIRAVVLRVNSGGGSAFASEIIAQQVRELRAAGKPVVVSMGDVAASGGYWISMDADLILASPVTITGSIGIGAVLPTFQRSLDWLGVHVDGVGTTPLAGALRPDRELGEASRRVLQQSVENGYEDFITRVARARDLEVSAVDAVARGRVWLGRAALDHELIDRFGDLDAALTRAARLADIEDDYSVRYLGQELGLREALALQLTRSAAAVADLVGFEPGRALGVPQAAPTGRGLAAQLDAAAAELARELERLRRWNDPRGLYLHCFCDGRR